MTRERLLSLTFGDLKKLANAYGIEYTNNIDRDEFIDILIDYFKELRKEREEINNLQVIGEERKYEITRDEEIEVFESQDYTLPDRYNETRLTVMVRDPSWAFAYWEIDESKLREIREKPNFQGLVLRVHNTENSDLNPESSFDIPLKESDNHWYINLPHPDCAYVMELAYIRNGKSHLLAKSNPIRTPRGRISNDADSDSSLQEKSTMLSPDTHFNLRKASWSGSIPQRLSTFQQ